MLVLIIFIILVLSYKMSFYSVVGIVGNKSSVYIEKYYTTFTISEKYYLPMCSVRHRYEYSAA